MEQQTSDLSIRVAVFSSAANADQAVTRLLDAGFAKQEITVICSDEKKELLFQRVSTPEPSSTQTPQAIAAGGAIGGALGGLALAATAVATGGTLLVAYGTILIGGGAIAGSFSGAMMSRGFSKQLAEYYEQSVQEGKILVGVQANEEGNAARLAEAERIFSEAGAEPISLPES